MKTLYLLRHAKSSWSDHAIEDHDRPLNRRGQENAPLMGQFMRKSGFLPDMILCSTSRRTAETLSLIVPYIGDHTPVQFERNLYLASSHSMLDRIKKADPKCDRLLVIAHNPGMEHLAADLISPKKLNGTENLFDALTSKYPTAALAVIQFDVEDWTDVELGAGELREFKCPRDLVPGKS